MTPCWHFAQNRPPAIGCIVSQFSWQSNSSMGDGFHQDGDRWQWLPELDRPHSVPSVLEQDPLGKTPVFASFHHHLRSLVRRP